MAARCRENWPNRLVNNFGQKIYGTHGSWMPLKYAEKSMHYHGNMAQL